MIDERIVRKISALLARADAERNDNEHEREIAMRQANALMARHSLTIATLNEEEQKQSLGDFIESEDDYGHALWQASIFHQSAKLHSCRAIRSRQNKTIHILGRESNVQVTREIAKYLIDSIKREMPKAWNQLEGKANINRRSFNTSFGNGAVMGVSISVKRILQERKHGQINGEQLSAQNALVLVNSDKNALIETNNYVKNIYPNLRSGATSRSYSHQGYHAGKRFGATVSLNRQVGASTRYLN